MRSSEQKPLIAFDLVQPQQFSEFVLECLLFVMRSLVLYIMTFADYDLQTEKTP